MNIRMTQLWKELYSNQLEWITAAEEESPADIKAGVKLSGKQTLC